MAGVAGRSGGVRNGSGRKPKADRYKTAISRAEKSIADRLPDLVGLLFELAEGVTVQETDSHGKDRIYTRPPDFKAASYLVDRVMGKPVQSVNAEHSGEGGGSIRIRVEYDDSDPRVHDKPAPPPPRPAASSE